MANVRYMPYIQDENGKKKSLSKNTFKNVIERKSDAYLEKSNTLLKKAKPRIIKCKQ